MKSLFVIFLGSILTCTLSFATNLNVVPKPQSVVMLDGKVDVSQSITINSDKQITNSIITDQIIDEFELVFGDISKKGQLNINLKIFDEIEDLSNYFKLNENKDLNKLNDEGYLLKISDEGIDIAAKTEKGIFYGVQTLKQILRSNKEFMQIPYCLVIDYPNLWFRSISDDISRGPIPTMDFLKYQIRRASELKYNHWMHYVEHVVKTKKHGAFAPSDGSLTIAEIKELSEYAKKYYITFFGNFQSFGHFRAINSYPQYQHLIEMETILSPTLDESYKFLEEIYDELIPAFDAPFFAINCDETFDLGKSMSKNLVDSIGIAQVFTDHISRIKKIVDKHNVKTIIWADEPLKYPEILDDLPKDIILGTWIYDAKDNFDEYIEPIKARGYQFMFAPGVLNSTRVMPNFHNSTTNIRNFNRDGFNAGAMGMLNCVWDDGGHSLFNRDWYGVAYGGEQSWNYNEETIEEFNNRFNLGIYGDKTNALTNSIYKLLELANFAPTDNMNKKIVWTNTIPNRFEKISIALDDWDVIKEICNESAELLVDKENLLYEDDYLVYKYTAELYEFVADLRLNIVTAADSYRDAMLTQNDKILCRKNLMKAQTAIDELLIKQNKIYYDYKHLWLIENRTYALDRVTDKMEAQYSQLKKLSNRLLESLKDFDKGLYLKPPNDVGLEVNKITGQYFRGWLMMNPLPYEENADADYLSEIGGELEAKPKVTNEFYYKSKKYRWKRVYSKYLDKVDLKELFPEENQNCVVYAFAELSVKKDMNLTASIGVNDRAEVILNGEKVLILNEKRDLIPDEINFEIKLKEGKNYLMLKIPQTDGNWEFTFKLSDAQFKGHKNRYRIAN